ncbi:MAG: hypothetical protein ACLQU4_12530, partial [Limisphaerales bacterium]
TLALKAALCLFRFAFISLLFLIYSRPAKVELNQWSKNRGPAQWVGRSEQNGGLEKGLANLCRRVKVKKRLTLVVGKQSNGKFQL